MPSRLPLYRRLGFLEANAEVGFRVPDPRGKGTGRGWTGRREKLNWCRQQIFDPSGRSCEGKTALQGCFSCFLFCPRPKRWGLLNSCLAHWAGMGALRRTWSKERWPLTAEVTPGGITRLPADCIPGGWAALRRVLAEHGWAYAIPITKLHKTALKYPKREAIYNRFFPYFLENFLIDTLNNYFFCSSFGSKCQVVMYHFN